MMLTPAITKQELKTQLVKNLDKFDEEKLLLIHQFVSTLIAEELIDSVTEDWESAKVNREAVQKAIQEHRKTYPYGEKYS